MNATPAEASWTEKIAQISPDGIAYDGLETPIEGSYQYSGGIGQATASAAAAASAGEYGSGAMASGAPVSISSLGSHGRNVLNSTRRNTEQLI
jgi:hypothetical protein